MNNNKIFIFRMLWIYRLIGGRFSKGDKDKVFL